MNMNNESPTKSSLFLKAQVAHLLTGGCQKEKGSDFSWEQGAFCAARAVEWPSLGSPSGLRSAPACWGAAPRGRGATLLQPQTSTCEELPFRRPSSAASCVGAEVIPLLNGVPAFPWEQSPLTGRSEELLLAGRTESLRTPRSQ